MLVIFDDKNRTSGVKDYLINGEKINSKYIKNTGLSNYLNKGKLGDRDIKDRRVPLFGDLDVLDEVIKVASSRGSTEAYRNFVLTFEEDNISNQHLMEITKSFIKIYMVGYQEDEYIAYAEAHLPKIKYKIDKNGEKIRRHAHVHISISKYSPKFDCQLDLGHNGDYVKTGGRCLEIELWKKNIEQKYNLRTTEKKAISPSNSYKTGGLKETREALGSHIHSKINNINNLNELITDLLNYDFVKSIKKSINAKTPYISIKLKNGKNVRLKGRLFNDKSFDKAKEELLDVTNKYSYSESSEPINFPMPNELIRLQNARANKINKVLKKKRSEAVNLLSELSPVGFRNSTKDYYKNEEVVSSLSYLTNDIELKNNNNKNLENYNKNLDAGVLLHHLKDSHNINLEIYHAYSNKDNEFRIEVGTKNYNISDFLIKEMNLDWLEVVKYLSYVYKKQQEKNKSLIVEAQKSQINIYQRLSYQNKVFIDIYKTNSNIDLSTYFISRTDKKTTLTKKGISIEDTGDTLQSPQNCYNLTEQVNLILELAIAKGWNIEDLEIDGTERFRQEVYAQVTTLRNPAHIEKKSTRIIRNR